MTDDEILELAVDLAAAAAARILAIRAGGFTVMAKADATPVTVADAQAEAIILSGLRAALPGIPVVAEEAVAAGDATQPGETFFLVDPLDGTREFAVGRDAFTVNIGLVRHGAPVLGAVAVPALQKIYFGQVGQGAWVRQGDATMRITARAAPPEGLTVMASRHYADDPALAAHLAGLRVARLLNIGSALKFLVLAEGAADYYPRLGRTMEWDTAAPQAVLEAAGGTVLTGGGEPLRYGKPGWENPDFFCRGLLP